MKIYQKIINLIINLKFAIFLLLFLAFSSSLGSLIEQNEEKNFYYDNYSKALYGFINSSLILNVGLDHLYTTWWFILLLIILGLSLFNCTLIRQFPLVKNSKIFQFKKSFSAFNALTFFLRIPKNYELDSNFLLLLKKNFYFIYHKKNAIYLFKGLVGRISPVLVHISLLLILSASSLTAFNAFKIQEIIPKGEIIHLQNFQTIGKFNNLPCFELRINDFWIEYRKKILRQFYSDVSILNSSGKEIKHQTISVNNPLIYKNIDIYQSDWNIIGIREKNFLTNKNIEYPLFFFGQKDQKNLITWIKKDKKVFTLVLNNLQGDYFIYNREGKFLERKNNQEVFQDSFLIFDILPLSGLSIKYDPNIFFVYSGFGGLIFSSFLSYLPYNQLWIILLPNQFWISANTNRGKNHLEIENENFLRILI